MDTPKTTPNPWRDLLLERLERAGVDIKELKTDPSEALTVFARHCSKIASGGGAQMNDMPKGVLVIEDTEGFKIEGGSTEVDGSRGNFPILMFMTPPYTMQDTLHIVFKSKDAFRQLGHAFTGMAMAFVSPEETSLMEEYLKRG